jgi:hypothetical protein
LSDGYTIYNGQVADVKPYFENEFGLHMPKYTNPSDYLIKLATVPSLVDPGLSIQKLVKAQEKNFALNRKANEEQLSHLRPEALKSIVTLRSTNFSKQFKVLLARHFIGLQRAPFAIFALFGMAVFSVILISSIFANTG